METLDQMKAVMLSEYQAKFDTLEKIAFELHNLDEKELEMTVIKRMSGYKLLIDQCIQAGCEK